MRGEGRGERREEIRVGKGERGEREGRGRGEGERGRGEKILKYFSVTVCVYRTPKHNIFGTQP